MALIPRSTGLHLSNLLVLYNYLQCYIFNGLHSWQVGFWKFLHPFICCRGCLIGPTFHFSVPELNFGDVSFGKWTCTLRFISQDQCKRLMLVLHISCIIKKSSLTDPRVSANADMSPQQHFSGAHELWTADPRRWYGTGEHYQHGPGRSAE